MHRCQDYRCLMSTWPGGCPVSLSCGVDELVIGGCAACLGHLHTNEGTLRHAVLAPKGLELWTVGFQAMEVSRARNRGEGCRGLLWLQPGQTQPCSFDCALLYCALHAGVLTKPIGGLQLRPSEAQGSLEFPTRDPL